jgi:predicted CDP-diglyceride synthetase/phosphatidate cytidylyltransferase
MDNNIYENFLNLYTNAKKIFDFLFVILKSTKIFYVPFEYFFNFSYISFYFLKCFVTVLPILIPNLTPIICLILENCILLVKFVCIEFYKLFKYLTCVVFFYFESYCSRKNDSDNTVFQEIHDSSSIFKGIF